MKPVRVFKVEATSSGLFRADFQRFKFVARDADLCVSLDSPEFQHGFTFRRSLHSVLSRVLLLRCPTIETRECIHVCIRAQVYVDLLLITDEPQIPRFNPICPRAIDSRSSSAKAIAHRAETYYWATNHECFRCCFFETDLSRIDEPFISSESLERYVILFSSARDDNFFFFFFPFFFLFYRMANVSYLAGATIERH